MQAVILSIGDELVLGQTVDTNSTYLSAQLATLGVGTRYHQTVADDQALITQAIRQAAEAVALVVVTGGLGPTDDDLTRPALAAAMGVDLVLDTASVEAIRERFSKRGREMPDRNKVQAMHPRGSIVIPNSCGTAPGIKATLGKATIYVTPGVPSELFAMFEQSILPELRVLGGARQVILAASVHTFGMGESTVADRLGELCRRDRNPLVGTTVSDGIVSVRVRSEFADAGAAARELDATVDLIQTALGPVVFGRDGQTLATAVISLLKDRGMTLCTAESCTGGWLGKLICDVPGCGDVYLGGWVTYSYAMKAAQLGVDAALLERQGAVNEEVARQMAQGAAERSGADIALSVTGVAGPDRGVEKQEVGTVWIGISVPDGKAADGRRTDAIRYLLPGDRATVRDRAAKTALQLVRMHALGHANQMLFAAPNRG